MGLVQGSSLSCSLFIIFANDFFQSNKFFSVAFADGTNVASKCKSLSALADTKNKELEKKLVGTWLIKLITFRKPMQLNFQIL